MIGFCPLASGSKGNCTYLGTKSAKILIDAGISARMIQKRLAEIAVDLEEIDAILISHEHMDHISALKILSGKKGIPIFANADTAKSICSLLDIQPTFKIFTTGEPFYFRDLEIFPFSIQHDTLDPVAFRIRAEKWIIGFCTDLGFVTSLVRKHLQNCDYLYLEANHEPSMVYASPRSHIYKNRVLGRQGHLSNLACAELLSEVYHDKLKHVHLAHLSQECNAESVALSVVREFLEVRNQKVELSIAYQEKISCPIILEGNDESVIS